VHATPVPRSVWIAERDAQRARVRPWTEDRIRRSLAGNKHAVYDFLFEYYAYRPSQLLRYSPGIAALMAEAASADLDWPGRFRLLRQGALLDPSTFPLRRLPALRWGIRFLEATLDREPVYSCFGLHEWAMLYQTEDIRHSKTPLRLTPNQIAAVVDGQRLCCTHFDAFRFFTPKAASLNRHQLSRAAAIQFDQPGCIHANMDLYKWAFHFSPFSTSAIVTDCFELARQAREIDMRASPYDLRALGFDPIPIETKAGREEYMAHQRVLSQQSRPLRARLLAEYRRIESCVVGESSASRIQAVRAQPFSPAENAKIPLSLTANHARW
jgi:hypothetical protein